MATNKVQPVTKSQLPTGNFPKNNPNQNPQAKSNTGKSDQSFSSIFAALMNKEKK